MQMTITPREPEKNIARAMELSKEAFRQEVDILCFPEIFATGPVGDAVPKFAQRIPGRYTDIFTGLALERGAYIIAGSIIEEDSGKYYNTSVLVSPEGDIVGKYRKIFLWHPEKESMRRGSETPVFDTGFGKVGIEICWDLGFPEVSRELAVKGAEIIFCPSYWSEGDNPQYKDLGFSTESLFVDTCTAARALENEAAFVFVNGCGPWKLEGYSDELVGHTQVALPFYGSVSMLEAEEGVLVYDVDLSVCKRAREVYSIIDDVKEVRRLKKLYPEA